MWGAAAPPPASPESSPSSPSAKTSLREVAERLEPFSLLSLSLGRASARFAEGDAGEARCEATRGAQHPRDQHLRRRRAQPGEGRRLVTRDPDQVPDHGLGALARWRVRREPQLRLASLLRRPGCGARPGPVLAQPAPAPAAARPRRRAGVPPVDERGAPFANDAMLGHVSVVDFVFTRCPSSCPRLTARMGELQARLKKDGSDARLVSFSVDPENDTPPVLAAYAAKAGAEPGRWTFVTGPVERREPRRGAGASRCPRRRWPRARTTTTSRTATGSC